MSIYLHLKRLLQSLIQPPGHEFAFLIHKAEPDVQYDDLLGQDMLDIKVFMAHEGQYPEGRILVVWTEKLDVPVEQILQVFKNNNLKATYLPACEQKPN